MRTRTRRILRRPLLFAAVVVVLPVLIGTGVGAATPAHRPLATKTYVVNSTADSVDADTGAPACRDAHGKCTLRAAIMQANFHTGPDIIKVPAGHYTLTRKGNDDGDVLGDLDITDSVTIEGAGESKTVIDANGKVTKVRAIQILPTATAVTIGDLTVTGGLQVGSFEEGGGIDWEGRGQLTVDHVTLTGNHADYGGGIAVQGDGGETARLSHVTVTHNVADAAGAGIDAVPGQYGTFVLNGSTLSANKAYEAAGAALATSSQPPTASIVISHTTFDHNAARGLAGALENYGVGTQTEPTEITDSYFRDNTGGAEAGAIHNVGVADVDGSTFQGNSAAKGGVLYDDDGAFLTFTNDTLAQNTASQQGGGVYAEFFTTGTGDVAIRSSTLVGNSAPEGGAIYVASGAKASFANSIVATGTTGTNCNAPITGLTSLSNDNSCGFGAGDGITDLGLGPIGPHGGATPTVVPKAGSPALDAGTAAGAPTTDQRGFTRPMGTGVDIGAVEVCPQAPSAPTRLAPGKSVTTRRVTLDWSDVTCTQSYQLGLRLGSSMGKLVEHKTGLTVSTLRTKKLARGRTYFWRVEAVGDRGATKSVWRHFHVKAVPKHNKH